jgi:UDP-glucose 4-epimerase
MQPNNLPILVTGGTGYIGSHVCVALAKVGHPVIILDNLCNSSEKVIARLAAINGTAPILVQGDVRDGAFLASLFAKYPVAGVIHLAGLKAVGESVAQPLRYYDNNVAGSITLLQAMQQAGVNTFIFSSSATVYGDPDVVPIPEDAPLHPESPYGETKMMVEHILVAHQKANPNFAAGLLRYFNPVGAHESGTIGEAPQGVPNNLMPYIAQVAVGIRQELRIFGSDYPTADGTGERDYVHVMDLAEGHVLALQHLLKAPGLLTLNLGTGKGISVLAMVKAFEQASGQPIAYTLTDRRPGDVPAYWASPAKAEQVLGWRAQRDLHAMCADTWRWQRLNPKGFE